MARLVVWTFAVGAMMLDSGAVYGQKYPNRPIRIVTAEAGGGVDFAARLVAQGLSANLGQSAIVDNRAGGVIPAEIVSKAPSDGHTLLVHGGTFFTAPLLQQTRFDPVTDFLPISLVGRSPNVLVVHPSVPSMSVKELIAFAKARPGELNYASGSTGSTSQLAGELFKSMASVNIVRVQYKGTGPALNALMGGEVQVMFPAAALAAPHIKPGRLKALAVTSAEPSPLAPGLPTVAASGLPDYQSVSPFGIYAPAKTPAAIVTRLNQEIVRFLKGPEERERFLRSGVEAVGSSPEDLAAFIKSEMARLGKVIKDAGI